MIFLIKNFNYFSRNLKKKSLQIPAQMRDTFSSLISNNKQQKKNAPQNKVKANALYNSSFPNKKQKDIDQINIEKIDKLMEAGKTQEDILRTLQSKTNKVNPFLINDPSRLFEVSQDLLIEQIKKNSPVKQIKIDTIQSKQKAFLMQHLKRDHILDAMKQGLQPNKANLDFTEQDFIRTKYSPELISKAQNYKNKQLSYFKRLILNEKDEGEGFYKRGQKNAKGPVTEIKKKRNDMQIQNKDIKKQQEGISRFEDLQYLKDEGIKQFIQRQRNTSKDKEILKEGQKDLEQSTRENHKIFLEQRDAFTGVKYKDDVFKESSFGKQMQRVKKITMKLQNLGLDIDIEQVQQMDKQLLFQDKKFRQQQQQFQKHVHKRQKKKQMKQYMQKIHMEKLNQNIDYDKPSEPGFNMKKVGALDIDQAQKAQQEASQKKAASIMSEEDKGWLIHKTKTLRKMQIFLSSYFHSNNLIHEHQHSFQNIQVQNIMPNNSLTVLNLFWNFKHNQLGNRSQVHCSQQEINKTQKRLTKSSNYISGKMTQFLGLRYGPDIRFHYNLKLQKTLQIRQELKKCKDQIVKQQVKNYKNKGFIKTIEDEQLMVKKINALAQLNIQKFNSQKILLSKYYKQNKRKQQATSKKRPKTVKKNAVEKFWQQVDKL